MVVLVIMAKVTTYLLGLIGLICFQQGKVRGLIFKSLSSYNWPPIFGPSRTLGEWWEVCDRSELDQNR